MSTLKYFGDQFSDRLCMVLEKDEKGCYTITLHKMLGFGPQLSWDLEGACQCLFYTVGLWENLHLVSGQENIVVSAAGVENSKVMQSCSVPYSCSSRFAS